MKDRIIELSLVVRIDHRIEDDLELLIKEYLTSEGLMEVSELHRLDFTGTIDLPRVWLPTAPERHPSGVRPPPLPPPTPKPFPAIKKKKWWDK